MSDKRDIEEAVHNAYRHPIRDRRDRAILAMRRIPRTTWKAIQAARAAAARSTATIQPHQGERRSLSERTWCLRRSIGHRRGAMWAFVIIGIIVVTAPRGCSGSWSA